LVKEIKKVLPTLEAHNDSKRVKQALTNATHSFDNEAHQNESIDAVKTQNIVHYRSKRTAGSSDQK